MEEDMIQARMSKIMDEFAQLSQLDKFDLTLESVGSGDIKVTVRDQVRKGDWAERVISANEDLSFIGSTFDYPNTFNLHSKPFHAPTTSNVFFDEHGYLISISEDGSQGKLRVAPEQRELVCERLKRELGDKFKKPSPKAEVADKAVSKRPVDLLYKIYFTINGKQDYLIVSGDSLERIKATALDILKERGLDYEKNNVWSEKIKN